MDPKSKPCPLSKKKPPPRPGRTAEEVKMDQALKKFYSKDLFSLPPEPKLPDNEFMLEGRRRLEERELKLMNQTTTESDGWETEELEPGEIPRYDIPEDVRRQMEDNRKRAKMNKFNPYEEREKKFKKYQAFGYPPQNVPLKMYQCKLVSCERKFYNLYDYLDHERLHEIGDLPPFICPVCGSRYAKLKRCAVHMSMHRNNGEMRAPGTDYEDSAHLIMSKAPYTKKPLTQLDADYLLAKQLQEEEDEASRKNNAAAAAAAPPEARPKARPATQNSGLDCLAEVCAALAATSQPMKVVEVMEDTEFQFDPEVATQGTVKSADSSTTHGSIEIIELSSTQESAASQSASQSVSQSVSQPASQFGCQSAYQFESQFESQYAYEDMTPEEQLLADYLLAQSLQEEEDNQSRNDYLARANTVKEEIRKPQIIIQHDEETTECDSDVDLNASEKLQMDLLAARYNAEKRAAGGAVVESSSQDSELVID